ncbi:centriolar coiled-coil protein of 110 kDa isoform X2 [Anabrus simplex]|uniref:centriolar coiled-coil protein of 110 kDa isoform X2 n=1 Tax=Anabrus simplex TaxID=316456 RepID=UPI0035A2FE47
MSRIQICGQILLPPLISDEEHRGILWKYKQQAMEIEKTIESKRITHNSSTLSCSQDLQFPTQEPEVVDESGVHQGYLDVGNEQGADDHIALPLKTIFTTITTTSDEQGSPIDGGNTYSPPSIQEVFNPSSAVSESGQFLETNDTIVKDTNNKSMDKTDTEDNLSVSGAPSDKRHTSDVQSSELDDSGVSQVTDQSYGPRLQRQRTFVVDVPSPALLEYAKEIGQNNDNPINLDQDDLPQVSASSTVSIEMVSPVSCLHEDSSGNQDPKFFNEVKELDKEQYHLHRYERLLEIILTKLDEKQQKEAAEFHKRQVYEKCLLIRYLQRYCQTTGTAQTPENEFTSVEIADAERLLTGFGISADVLQVVGDQAHLGNNVVDLKDNTSNTEDIQMLESCENYEENSRVEDFPTTEKLDLYTGVNAVSSCGPIKTEDNDEKIQKAASKINAAARGYLTRKLMKSSHVKSIMELITSTVEFALQLQKDSEINVVPSDVQLHGRLIGQVTAACNEFYDIFFNKSVHERMLIIAADRKKRIKSHVEKRLSSATEKVIKRKQLKVAHPDSNTNGRGKEELQGQSHFSCAEFNSSSPAVANPIGPERVRSPPSSPSPKKALRKSSLGSPAYSPSSEICVCSVRIPPQLAASEMPSAVRSPPQLAASEMPSAARCLQLSATPETSTCSVRSFQISETSDTPTCSVMSPQLSVTPDRPTSSVRSSSCSLSPQRSMHSGHSPPQSSPPAACEFRSPPRTPPRRRLVPRSLGFGSLKSPK